MKRTIAALATAGLLLAGLTATPAEAATTCDVPSGLIYNIPDGTKSQGTKDEQFRWHNLLACMADAAPEGSYITGSAFSWGHQESADALLRADARGVNVRLAMWTGRPSGISASFAEALNDGKTKGSWFKACRNSCLGPNPSASSHHAKVWTFSEINTPTGPLSYVSNIGTGNPSLTNGQSSWNAWHSIPNNQTVYAGLTSYVLRMRSDRDQRPATATVVKSGATSIYLYPQKKALPDQHLNVLNSVNCKGGSKTEVLIAIYQWTDGRLALARRAAQLRRCGVRVTAIVNYDTATLGTKEWPHSSLVG